MPAKIYRRDFLSLMGISFFSCIALGDFAYAYNDKQKSFFASAYMDSQKRYGIAIFDQDGNIISSNHLPGRGHGIAKGDKSSWFVVFARRPGNFALATNHDKKQEPILFKTPLHTHFYGHGTFSIDGKLLYATENEFEGGAGVIGIYDVNNRFSRIGEFPSYGIGPHDIILMPGDKILCVANGGIMTHPDTGRTKLNLHEMQSSVSFIDITDGQLIDTLYVPNSLQRLSLRHMAIDKNHEVWLGGQYEGSQQEYAPLIAIASLENGLEFPDIGPVRSLGLANYVGSVANSSGGQKIAFTSPKGNTLLVVDVKKKTVLEKKKILDVCGISGNKNSFVTTSLSGKINDTSKKEIYWDNHIKRVS